MSDTQFRKLEGLLSVDDDTDRALDTLTAARGVILKAARQIAEDALHRSNRALDDALDGELCITVFDDVLRCRRDAEIVQDLCREAGQLTHMICAIQQTGDEDTDDTLLGIEMVNMGTDPIFALMEAIESRIDTVLETMPDNTSPGARCVPFDEEDSHGGPEDYA